jgi:hypothetical protein
VPAADIIYILRGGALQKALRDVALEEPWFFLELLVSL